MVNQEIKIYIFNNKFFHQNNMQSESENDMLNIFNIRRITDRNAYITISDCTLSKLIIKLNDGMGHDLIHSRLLKNANLNFINNIVVLLNCCFNHNFIPNEMLKGDILPIIKEKNGNISSSNNYRPIMQSSCILKLLELHILEFLDEKVFFNSTQFGFERGVSTSHACLLLKEILFKYRINNMKVYALFADLSKAFERVDHFKLGNLLLSRNVPPDLVHLIMVYLRNQKARVRWNGSSGDYSYVNWGVRQGGIISPLLFKLYVDDILDKINSKNEACSFGLSRIGAIAYADDVILLSHNLDGLRSIFRVFSDELKHRNLKINESKTKCMIFNEKQKNVPSRLKFNNFDFEIVSSMKYLGNTISNDLLDNEDVELKLHNFYKSFHSIFRSFCNINIETFLYLFNMYCTPSYGIELWNPSIVFKKQIFKTFEIAYSSALKRICSVPKYTSSHWIAEMTNQLLFKHYFNLLQARFFKRLGSCNKPLFILNCYFIKSGYFYTNVLQNFRLNYQIDISFLDVDIIKSRIEWVQLHESNIYL